MPRARRDAPLGTLMLVLACGRAGDESQNLLLLGTSSGPGYLVGELPEAGASELPPSDGNEAASPSGEIYPGERALLDVTERACGGCHSADPEDPGGFLFSVNGLRDASWLQPGAGEASRIAVWLQYGYGDAVPGHSSFDLESTAYRQVVEFINSMAPVSCEYPEPKSRDAATEAMLSDIQARAPADRPFIRYIGITHGTSNAPCSTFSIQDRAMLELLNAVSLGPDVVSPPLIETAFIHAIDLRDLAWNRPVALDSGGAQGALPDAWEAVVAATQPFAQELVGPEADALKLATGTGVPYVPAHAFVAVASAGDLYHALVGATGNIAAMREALGVVDGSLLRAGTFGPPGTAADRVVGRRVQGDLTRSWWTREWVEAAPDGGGLQQHPVDYPASGGEVMFELPNGLYAFLITSADGALLAQEPSCLGVCDPPVAADGSATCRGCHGAGRLLVPPDEVRAFADGTPTAFDAATLASIRDQYRPDELQALLAADVERHGRALDQLPQNPDWQNVIGQVYNAFWLRPIDASTAAAELGVTVTELRGAIGAVDASGAAGLAPLLGEGGVDRSLFSASYQALACAIGGSRNLPAGCP
jgi:hypothetical protein